MPIIWSVLVVVILLDQVSKYLVMHNLPYMETVNVIKGLFSYTYVHNYGAAFGILQNKRVFFIIVAILMVGAMFAFYRRIPHHWLTQVALGLAVGGALGNCLDRIRLGYVVDFLDFHVRTIINVADMGITVGMVIIAWQILFEDRHQKEIEPRVEAFGAEQQGSEDLTKQEVVQGLGVVQALEMLQGQDSAQEREMLQGQDSAQEQEILQGQDSAQEQEILQGQDTAQEQDVMQGGDAVQTQE